MGWSRKREPEVTLRQIPHSLIEDCLDAAGFPRTTANLDYAMRTAAQTGLNLAYRALSDDYAARADIWIKNELGRGRIISVAGLQDAFERAAAWQPRAKHDLNRGIDVLVRTLSDGEGWDENKLER